jgi:hypothetical protein
MESAPGRKTDLRRDENLTEESFAQYRRESETVRKFTSRLLVISNVSERSCIFSAQKRFLAFGSK